MLMCTETATWLFWNISFWVIMIRSDSIMSNLDIFIFAQNSMNCLCFVFMQFLNSLIFFIVFTLLSLLLNQVYLNPIFIISRIISLLSALISFLPVLALIELSFAWPNPYSSQFYCPSLSLLTMNRATIWLLLRGQATVGNHEEILQLTDSYVRIKCWIKISVNKK